MHIQMKDAAVGRRIEHLRTYSGMRPASVVSHAKENIIIVYAYNIAHSVANYHRAKEATHSSKHSGNSVL